MPKRPPKPHHKQKPPRHRGQAGLPEICVLLVTGTNEDGDLVAEPQKRDPHRRPPHIVLTESGRGQAASVGDRVLAKMRKIKPHLYQALVIRVLPDERPQQVLGVFVATAEGGLIEPVSRKLKESFIVARADSMDAKPGELVSGETLPGVPSMGMSYAKITERLGNLDSPKAASLIAANMHNLPSVFSDEALEEAAAAEPPVMQPGRVDLRGIPLVTIDGEDARDFDDAVFAEPDGDGFHLLVAIADVAYYVKEGSALDREAFERGNSVYFPDRVIPMLPERLSNGLCSLTPNEDRYCLAVHLWIDAQGKMLRYRFERGLMRSAARLTYNDVQAAHDAKNDHPQRSRIEALYDAYAALATERDRRGALNLNLPEYKVQFDEAGNVAAIAPRAQLEAHRLIESYMIAANVAAADWLLKNKIPAIYRVHETPDEEKMEDLTKLLKMSGYSLHVGAGLKAAHFNRVLKQAEGAPEAFMVNTAVLRSQMQAYYSNENLGHFGLSLQKYCHFTSPIRRYSDLVVHRGLIEAMNDGTMKDETLKKKNQKSSSPSHRSSLPEVALHISETERRAMMAERDASDRYKVSYMSRHVGEDFGGVIVSLNEYGLFVSLSDTGVTGFIPVRNLAGPDGQRDFFTFDRKHACFKGQRSKFTYGIGQPVAIRVQSANAITGSLIFEPISPESTSPAPRKRQQEERLRSKRREPKSRKERQKRRDRKRGKSWEE